VAGNQDIEHDENITNMFIYIDKVAKLQEAIERTVIPATLPLIVAAFLNQQLKLCVGGCNQVRLFINFISDYFQSEMDYIKSFQTHLDHLKTQPLTELLLEIQSQTDGASKCIQAFTHKKFLMDDIQKTSLLLTSVETFHRILTTDFIPYLESHVDKKNGLLNPHTIAAARSREYFTGMKGLWRFVRMLLFSMSVNTFISTVELEEKIAKAIGSCSFFFKQEAKDSEKISMFIDNFFSDYKRPFPHDELIAMTKKSIVTYATILEKVFFKYKPKQPEDDDNQGVMALGRLSAKIEIRTDTLMKYREKFEV
jgi:hypothetical protein